MSNDMCRTYHSDKQCEPEVVHEGHDHICQPFEVCLPFGRKIGFDGECLYVEGESNIPDGSYGIIEVKNGCIVGARPNPAFEYTPPPCSPAATPCDEGGSNVDIAPGSNNLISQDGAGRLIVTLVTQAGRGIRLSGVGTASSPLKIEATEESGITEVVARALNEALTVTGKGTSTNPLLIGLTETGITPGTYGDFTVDAYGRIINYSAGSSTGGATGIHTIIGTNGINASVTSGVATLSLDMEAIKSLLRPIVNEAINDFARNTLPSLIATAVEAAINNLDPGSGGGGSGSHIIESFAKWSIPSFTIDVNTSGRLVIRAFNLGGISMNRNFGIDLLEVTVDGSVVDIEYIETSYSVSEGEGHFPDETVWSSATVRTVQALSAGSHTVSLRVPHCGGAGGSFPNSCSVEAYITN